MAVDFCGQISGQLIAQHKLSSAQVQLKVSCTLQESMIDDMETDQPEDDLVHQDNMLDDYLHMPSL